MASEEEEETCISVELGFGKESVFYPFVLNVSSRDYFGFWWRI